MRRIGLIGGMSPESTTHYYEGINRQVNERAGGPTSADLVLRSVNFAEYHKLMEEHRWDEIAYKLIFESLHLTLSDKCDYVAIATNTMHKVADKIVGPHDVLDDNIWPKTYSKVSIPLVHIGDCIAEKCKEIGAERVLLLGTKFTMTEDFLKRKLAMHGIQTMSVGNYPDEIAEINRIIFDELCHGVVTPESKEFMMNFIYQFPADSDIRPDAVVLGCTELDMIITPEDVDLPLIDSTRAHIDKIVELCLGD